MRKNGIFKKCKWCRSKFYVIKYFLNRKFFCSKQCYSDWQKGKPNFSKTKFKKGRKAWNKGKPRYWKSFTEFKKGKDHPFFKGKIKHKGYVLVYSPNHPYKDKCNYVKRSRLVMEKTLSRYLTPIEVVHHINHIRDDDRPKNLMLLSNKSKHNKLHYPEGFNPLHFKKNK